jgi:uncharacterized protein (DUF58 family)
VTDTSSGEYRWRPSIGLIFGLVASIVITGGGILFSRPELILLAAPILVSVVWAYQRRPRSDAIVTTQSTIGTRQAADWVGFSVAVAASEQTDAVLLRLYERARERTELVVDASTAAHLTGQIGIVHSGPQELLRVDFSLVGPHGGTVTAPTEGPRSARVIPPRIVPLRRLPLPFRMFSLSGGHDSARPGEGGDFRDISQFVSGDRLRRIDWRVTARRAQSVADLYVRRSFATADATALIVMDSRDEVGELIVNRTVNGLKFDVATSLDIAREAASSIAAGYINSGDRVGFHDLAGSTRMVAPGAGATHLRRLLSTIARTRPVGAPQRRVRPPMIPAGALVYVLSTFLDGEAAHMAELWRVAGHRVIVVDTLPATPLEGLRREQQAAVRIIQLEREARILGLASLDVDVIRWRSAKGESPESQLSRRTRPGRAR